MNKKQTDYIWPIDLKYKVLEHDKYGIRKKHMILGKERWHSGFDITTRTKTPVKASSSGIVIAAGLDEKIVSGSANWNERYGIKVEILDKFSRRVVYAHLRTVSVTVGQYIKQGQIIGETGCSGGARIPHLHFEIRTKDTCHSGEENTIDPLTLLPQKNNFSCNHNFDEAPYDKIWLKFLDDPWGITDKEIPYAYDRNLIK